MLGITITVDLSWRMHTHNIATKCIPKTSSSLLTRRYFNRQLLKLQNLLWNSVSTSGAMVGIQKSATRLTGMPLLTNVAPASASHVCCLFSTFSITTITIFTLQSWLVSYFHHSGNSNPLVYTLISTLVHPISSFRTRHKTLTLWNVSTHVFPASINLQQIK